MGRELSYLQAYATVEGCDFCIELGGGTDDYFSLESNSTAQARIVAKFGDLSLFPCLGEILTGHLLLSPTYHSTSMLRLEKGHGQLLANTLNEIDAVFRMIHGEQPLFFEHGDPTAGREYSAQCVLHAHLHILPRWVDLATEIGRTYSHLGIATLDRYVELDRPYFMISDQKGALHLFDAVDAPRQHLRATYAGLVGAPERAFWYENLDFAQTLDSARRYRSTFRQAEL